MKTVSNTVKEIIENRPFLLEAMIRGIVSFGNLADELSPDIYAALGREASHSSIVMALRRYSSEMHERREQLQSSHIDYEINMKTNIFDINLIKSNTLLQTIHKVYEIVSLDRGDFLNITIGTNEVGIAVSQKYHDEITSLFSEKEVLYKKGDLVAVTVVFYGDFLNTPGVVYEAVRKLAWENINVYEIVSTTNELTFVLEKSDSLGAFEVLQKFL
ncbi:MAG: hypothetical protein K9L24_00620 [Spirochaetia bacterium]|nr:hypothetical protein [Spirochaetia bacterium]MCF7946315.1 hypothetical protein [Spirochaetia bacterium]